MKMKNKLCLVICGNFYREVQTIIESENYKDVTLCTFPSECVNYKKVEDHDLQKIIDKNKDECFCYEVICNAGCVNIKGIINARENADDVFHITNTELCFGLLVNRGVIDRYIREGYYILTPGWLSKWKHYVIDTWKFDKDIAREFFKESTSQLLLLDTGVYDNTHELMEEFSEYVGRPFRIIYVGLDYMRNVINGIVLRYKCEVQLDKEVEQHVLNSQKLIDYAMIFDIFSHLAKASSEVKVIENIIDMVRMLFGAGKVKYMAVEDEVEIHQISYPKGIECSEADHKKALEFKGMYRLLESGRGFLVRIESNEERLGMLCIDDIPREEFVMSYLNTFLNIRDVCGLAIRNARIYSEFVKSEKRLAFQKSYFQQLFKNSPEAIVILDKDLKITDVNDEFTKLFNYSIDEIKLRHSKDVTIPNDNIEAYLNSMFIVLKNGYVKDETKRLTKGGKNVDVRMLAYPILNQNELIGIYVIYSDITHRKEQEAMIHKLAFNDALTGLSTRRVFNDRLLMQLAKSKRDDEKFAVVYVDLNKFKEINDTYGHEVGDRILIEAALRLSTGIRESDTVARMGGDEFTLILTNVQSKETVKGILEKIIERMSLECIVDGTNVPIGASIGVAIFPDDGQDSESLVKKADRAMYEVKKTGKSGFKISI